LKYVGDVHVERSARNPFRRGESPNFKLSRTRGRQWDEREPRWHELVGRRREQENAPLTEITSNPAGHTLAKPRYDPLRRRAKPATAPEPRNHHERRSKPAHNEDGRPVVERGENRPGCRCRPENACTLRLEMLNALGARNSADPSAIFWATGLAAGFARERACRRREVGVMVSKAARAASLAEIRCGIYREGRLARSAVKLTPVAIKILQRRAAGHLPPTGKTSRARTGAGSDRFAVFLKNEECWPSNLSRADFPASVERARGNALGAADCIEGDGAADSSELEASASSSRRTSISRRAPRPLRRVPGASTAMVRGRRSLRVWPSTHVGYRVLDVEPGPLSRPPAVTSADEDRL